MSLLDEIVKESVWIEYLNSKLSKGHLSKKDEQYLREYIKEKKYMRIALKVCDGTYTFDYPVKKYINKADSSKKRIVYSYNEDESMYLRVLSYLLYEYDCFLCDNLYSFRRNCSPKQAIRRITTVRGIDNYYCYKADVSNYFNSIDTDIILDILKNIMINDIRTYRVFEQLLLQDKAYCEDNLIEEKRGAMAGTPFSPFLANIYLKALDECFKDNNVLYARYSDDIICFSKKYEDITKYNNVIKEYIFRYKLVVNSEKEYLYQPNEAWTFLGITYNNGIVDLSDATIMKMKGKIRRKARALYRWKIKKNASDSQAVKTMIKIFNRKFFMDSIKEADNTVLNWSRWFFPIINTERGLKIIDEHMQMYLRYIVTGKHGKKNYNLTYEKLKELGYRCLVNEYYLFKQNR